MKKLFFARDSNNNTRTLKPTTTFSSTKNDDPKCSLPHPPSANRDHASSTKDDHFALKGSETWMTEPSTESEETPCSSHPSSSCSSLSSSLHGARSHPRLNQSAPPGKLPHQENLKSHGSYSSQSNDDYSKNGRDVGPATVVQVAQTIMERQARISRALVDSILGLCRILDHKDQTQQVQQHDERARSSDQSATLQPTMVGSVNNNSNTSKHRIEQHENELECLLAKQDSDAKTLRSIIAALDKKLKKTEAERDMYLEEMERLWLEKISQSCKEYNVSNSINDSNKDRDDALPMNQQHEDNEEEHFGQSWNSVLQDYSSPPILEVIFEKEDSLNGALLEL